MKFKKFSQYLAISILSITALVACGNENSTESVVTTSGSSSNGEEVTKLKIAYGIAGKPIGYQDENGNPTGYEVEVMKLVDEKLEDYEFEYIGTTDDDILLGVAQGKYQVGVKNAFFTEERLETYLYPKEFFGLSSAGFILKKENEHIKTFQEFAAANLSLAPINGGDARYTVAKEYNDANPDNPLNLQANDGSVVDDILWVNEGRVDGSFYIQAAFNATVVDEKGPYHHLANDLVFNEVAVIKTYPLFAKGQDEFAAAFDEVIVELKEEGKLSELMLEFFGRDFFEVLDTVQR